MKDFLKKLGSVAIRAATSLKVWTAVGTLLTAKYGVSPEHWQAVTELGMVLVGAQGACDWGKNANPATAKDAPRG